MLMSIFVFDNIQFKARTAIYMALCVCERKL